MSFTIKTKAIQRTIDSLKKFTSDKPSTVVHTLGQLGQQIAQDYVPVETGDLRANIKYNYLDDTRCEVVADTPYAKFVEYGTGVRGKNSPHPETQWEYDINQHGDKGWWYYDTNQGRFRWTKGQTSKHFMYDTRKKLESMFSKIANEVYRK